MKAVEWWKPQKEETKKRRPYAWGVKAYLTSFEVGEERVLDGRFLYNSLRVTASRLHRYYGVQYTFRIIDAVRKVRRIA
jgi:hypothetical protein